MTDENQSDVAALATRIESLERRDAGQNDVILILLDWLTKPGRQSADLQDRLRSYANNHSADRAAAAVRILRDLAPYGRPVEARRVGMPPFRLPQAPQAEPTAPRREALDSRR